MTSANTSPTQTPNLVYILADDMGVGDVSCLDERCAWHTPRLDQLAAEGMRFTDAHSSSAVCTPSRYSILTGRYAWRSWLTRVTVGTSGGLLDDHQPTIASMLQQAGYRTSCVGKWHMGWEWACKKGHEMPIRDPNAIAGMATLLNGLISIKPLKVAPSTLASMNILASQPHWTCLPMSMSKVIAPRNPRLHGEQRGTFSARDHARKISYRIPFSAP